MQKKLSPEQYAQASATLSGWEKSNEREALQKTYVFGSFPDAFAWMTKIAVRAEQMNHHPEWSNIYTKVSVVLTTHDAGGITQLDIDMAHYMDECA